MGGHFFPMFTLDELLNDHTKIAESICSEIKPCFCMTICIWLLSFFLEKRTFSEKFTKTMNMDLEVDVLYINRFEQIISKTEKILYLLAISAPCLQM